MQNLSVYVLMEIFLQWSKWLGPKCVVSRQESCQEAEGLSGSVQGSVCTLNFDREIHYDDRGTYECIAIFLDEDKARANVDLDVWVRAQGQFEDLFGASEHEVQVRFITFLIKSIL